MRNLLMNKRGGLEDIFIWMIVGFVFIILGAGLLLGFGIVTNNLISVETGDSSVNVSDAAQKTFGQVNSGLQQIKWWAIGLMLGMGISIMISNFLIKVNPIFFMAYIIVAIVAIVVSIILANSYEVLFNGATNYSQEIKGFVGASWIFLNLPVWTTIIAVIGGALQFINFNREEAGGGLV